MNLSEHHKCNTVACRTQCASVALKPESSVDKNNAIYIIRVRTQIHYNLDMIHYIFIYLNANQKGYQHK